MRTSKAVKIFLFSNCFLSFIFASPDIFAQSSSDNSGGAAKLFGEVVLTTNYIEEGLSDSNSSLALQPNVGYQWTKARIGIWGSNVQYPTNAESLNLRPYGNYRFDFTTGYDLTVQYQLSAYFKSSNRNGNIISANLNLLANHIVISQNSNWWGTNTSSLWLAYQHIWKIIWDIDYKLEVGYEMLNAPGYNSFFAVNTGFGYKYSDLYYELLVNYNSSSGQFTNGVADPAIYFRLTAKF